MSDNKGLFLVYGVSIAAYFLFFSFLARLRDTGIWDFWAGPVAAFLPWMILTFVLAISASMLPTSLQQAGGMTGMFPMLALFALSGICPLISLFLSKAIPWTSRMKWFGGLSAIPALLLGAVLLWTFIRDSRGVK